MVEDKLKNKLKVMGYEYNSINGFDVLHKDRNAIIVNGNVILARVNECISCSTKENSYYRYIIFDKETDISGKENQYKCTVICLNRSSRKYRVFECNEFKLYTKVECIAIDGEEVINIFDTRETYVIKPPVEIKGAGNIWEIASINMYSTNKRMFLINYHSFNKLLGARKIVMVRDKGVIEEIELGSGKGCRIIDNKKLGLTVIVYTSSSQADVYSTAYSEKLKGRLAGSDGKGGIIEVKIGDKWEMLTYDKVKATQDIDCEIAKLFLSI